MVLPPTPERTATSMARSEIGASAHRQAARSAELAGRRRRTSATLRSAGVMSSSRRAASRRRWSRPYGSGRPSARRVRPLTELSPATLVARHGAAGFRDAWPDSGGETRPSMRDRRHEPQRAVRRSSRYRVPQSRGVPPPAMQARFNTRADEPRAVFTNSPGCCRSRPARTGWRHASSLGTGSSSSGKSGWRGAGGRIGVRSRMDLPGPEVPL